jgi:hypothetical protein
MSNNALHADRVPLLGWAHEVYHRENRGLRSEENWSTF